MNFSEKILEFMRREAYKPLSVEELVQEMDVSSERQAEFMEALNSLEIQASIIKTRIGKYGVPERMNLVVGRFDASSRGFGFVVPDTKTLDDVFIPPNAMLSAMNGDRVVARLNGRRSSGRSYEGEVIRIVKRANTKIVGTVEAGISFAFIVPDDAKIGQDIFVPKEELNGAKHGDKVVVEIVKWPEKRLSAVGKIIEVLGHKGDPGIEILSIIKTHNLTTEFPSTVLGAAARIPLKINEEEINHRKDLRNIDIPIVTVDSEDAKDLDDAVHVMKLANGNWLLGVHIADVSYYVKEDGVLDKEAFKRATSVYLVDRVIPMLPPRLSNGICSLNANEDRLTMSCEMEIDGQGKIVQYNIFPSVIRVHTRLSYNIVRGILEGNQELRNTYAELIPHIENMETLCKILRQKRLRRGAIDFDFPEIKVKLNETGKPVALVKRVRSIAESIIEEFMLAANETVAEHMHWLDVPFVYRIHEQPDTEKMQKLDLLLNNFNQHLGNVNDVHPRVLQQMLAHFEGQPEERFISTVMLRSLRQARYDSENVGHFGLASRFYTHFTSPIRRYPDLIVHRLLRETWKSKGMSVKSREKWQAKLPEITLHASERERAAAEAERDTVDLKKVEYMQQFLGDVFSAYISGVASYGIFVELENGVEGLVHVSTMDDDYYHYIEEQYCLRGERTGKTLRLGDPVEVQLLKVNLEERSIDFVLTPEFLRSKKRETVTDKPAKPSKPNNRTAKTHKKTKTAKRVRANKEKTTPVKAEVHLQAKSKPVKQSNVKKKRKHKSNAKSKANLEG